MSDKRNEYKGAALDAGAMIQQRIDAGEWFPAEGGRHGQFAVTNDGVLHRTINTNGKEEVTTLCGYLRIEGVILNAGGGGLAFLVCYENELSGRREQLIVPARFTLNSLQLLTLLTENGLRLDIDPPKGGGLSILCHYLKDFPRAGLPIITKVNKGGWLDDREHPFGTFVLKGESLQGKHGRRAILDTDEGEGVELKTSGTLSGWQATIGHNARYSSRIMFAICAAFAAPLLPILGGASAMYHFCGETSTGKSTTLWAANSVWGFGQPDTWDVTANNLQTLAVRHNNLTLCVDELKEMDKYIRNAIAYTFGNGTERGRNIRGGKAAARRSWLTIGLSAGEATLSEIREGKGMASGETARFIHIPALADENNTDYGVFDDLPPEVKNCEGQPENQIDDGERRASPARQQFIDSFKDQSNAGTAGREYLTRLLAHFDGLPGGVSEFVGLARKELDTEASAARWRTLTAIERRAFNGFNLIAFGGRLARRLGVLPREWTDLDIDRAVFGCFEAYRLGSETERANRARFVRALLDEPSTMGVSYQSFDRCGRQIINGARPPFEGWAGFLIKDCDSMAASEDNRDSGSARVIALVYAPEQFRRLIERIGGGLNQRECTKELRRLKMLYGNDQKKTPPYHPHKGAAPHFGMTGGGSYYVIFGTADVVIEAVTELQRALEAARKSGH